MWVQILIAIFQVMTLGNLFNLSLQDSVFFINKMEVKYLIYIILQD